MLQLVLMSNAARIRVTGLVEDLDGSSFTTHLDELRFLDHIKVSHQYARGLHSLHP